MGDDVSLTHSTSSVISGGNLEKVLGSHAHGPTAMHLRQE